MILYFIKLHYIRLSYIILYYFILISISILVFIFIFLRYMRCNIAHIQVFSCLSGEDPTGQGGVTYAVCKDWAMTG